MDLDGEVAADGGKAFGLKLHLQEHQDVGFVISDEDYLVRGFHHQDLCPPILSTEAEEVYKSFFLIKGLLYPSWI